MLKRCEPEDFQAIHQIINEAAQVYKGVIPADCYHEPYMSTEALQQEIAAGVIFWGKYKGNTLTGVMGVQKSKDAYLIRHAYVSSASQSKGVGSELINHILTHISGKVLVGAWADARWAITFYQKHGFVLAEAEEKNHLLQTYWQVPARQMETSVVLQRYCQAIL